MSFPRTRESTCELENFNIILLGPVSRVTGSAQTAWAEVDTPTHFAGVMDYANGAVGTLIITSDVHGVVLEQVNQEQSEKRAARLPGFHLQRRTFRRSA